MLQQLTERQLESVLDGEITAHVGNDKHDPTGRGTSNSPQRHRSKTGAHRRRLGCRPVCRAAGMPASSPRFAAKRQKRVGGAVISLAAKGLTTGEICAHLAEVNGAEVSRQTISAITDEVVESIVEWQKRPLDPGRLLPIVANDLGHELAFRLLHHLVFSLLPRCPSACGSQKARGHFRRRTGRRPRRHPNSVPLHQQLPHVQPHHRHDPHLLRTRGQYASTRS